MFDFFTLHKRYAMINCLIFYIKLQVSLLKEVLLDYILTSKQVGAWWLLLQDVFVTVFFYLLEIL